MSATDVLAGARRCSHDLRQDLTRWLEQSQLTDGLKHATDES
ncbi:MAG: hypothetical protein O2782_23300 [bacterium]|nr:hypothetical protein [bacterium]